MPENNVFFLHRDATISAAWLHDKHSVTMVFEIEKLIASAAQMTICETEPLIPAATFEHPHLMWALSSIEHVQWLYSYYNALSDRYRNVFHRKYRNHVTMQQFESLMRVFPRQPWQDPPLLVDSDCVQHDICESYRLYYIRCKIKVGSYKRVRMPYWVSNHMNESEHDVFQGLFDEA